MTPVTGSVTEVAVDKPAPRHDDLIWSVALMSLPQLIDRAAAGAVPGAWKSSVPIR